PGAISTPGNIGGLNGYSQCYGSPEPREADAATRRARRGRVSCRCFSFRGQPCLLTPRATKPRREPLAARRFTGVQRGERCARLPANYPIRRIRLRGLVTSVT